MTIKEQLIQEIDQAPEFLLEEVLTFFLFLKMRFSQRLAPIQSTPLSQTGIAPTFLSKAHEISQQISHEEWATLPKDLSKNLDHYLYGVPKSES